ncbi:hypothetical protein SLS60_003406 [Paraconiothyrium brasiliense]|uniref:Swi5-domain-containing protein n=1 Tax=Paraconiothyrium brasiliense TaxID=300254 RepID=A0ABR3RVK7_9PLEO
MAFARRVIEVPDSDDEPFTSSPEAPLYSACGQLDGTIEEPPQDASARAGGSFDRTDDNDTNRVARHDEQPVARDALQENTTDLKLSRQHTLSLTDTCDSYNWRPSVPTDLSALQILKEQEHTPASASGGNVKEPVTETDQSTFHPSIETPNTTSDASCADQHTLAADTQLLNHDEPSVLSSIQDTIACTAPTLEGSLPTTNLAGHDEAGLLHLDGEAHLQDRRSERSQSSPHNRENVRKDSTDAHDFDPRGSSFPPSLNPVNVSSSTNGRVLKRSRTIDRAVPVTKRAQEKDWEHAEAPQMPGLAKEEEDLQSITSPRQDASIFSHNVNAERPDLDMSNPQLEVTADPASGLETKKQSVNQFEAHGSEAVDNNGLDLNLSTADTSSLEGTLVMLHEMSKGHDVTETPLRDKNGHVSFGVERKINPSMGAETPRVESIPGYIPDPGTQTSSIAASTAKETQPIKAKSAQEITLEELRAKRASLIASLAALPVIRNIIANTDSLDTSSQKSPVEPTDGDVMSAAQKINRKHIKLLHEYNEIKDVGQGLMGLIADQRGVRIVEVQDEFGVDAKD